MDAEPRALFDATLDAAVALHAHMKLHAGSVLDAAAAIGGALRAGGKLLLFGNGGSAADAQHVAAEFVGRFQRERSAMAAIALTGGDGGAVGQAAAIHVNVPSAVTARVQGVHRTVLHVICDVVERTAVDA